MIIYLHGFNSTGDSAKGQALKAALGDKITFYTPTYHYDPAIAMSSLNTFIQEKLNLHTIDEPRLIIGSSLGGFYAQYLARQYNNFKTVLINPALGPVDTLKNHLGENENFYSGEKYVLQQWHLDELEKYTISSVCNPVIPTLVLIDKDDEVIDYHFAYKKYQPCARVILFDGGDHQFQHLNESIPIIENFYFS